MRRAPCPHTTAGVSTTIPTTPITVAPYLYHCEALPDSKRYGRRLTPATVTILWQSLFQYYRTSLSALDPTSTIQTGLGDAPQGRPRRQPCPKDEAADLHRVVTVIPLHSEDNLQTYTCKTPTTPYGYKRGGRAPHRGDDGTHGHKCNTQAQHRSSTHQETHFTHKEKGDSRY